MNLQELQRNWNRFGKQDPLWAVISYPEKKGGKWELEEFFQMGKDDISDLYAYLDELGVGAPRRQALDFGCGVGRLTQALAEKFDKVIGVDIAPSMINLARHYNRFTNRCSYYLNERDDLSLFKDNSFDLVCSLITLQHIHPRYVKRYLAEFLRVLAPGGVLYFQLPSRYLGREETPALSESGHKGSGNRIRAIVKNVMPEPLKHAYRTLRDWNKEPQMEMYGIERHEVEALLKKQGGLVRDVVEKRSTLSRWESFCYCVTKR